MSKAAKRMAKAVQDSNPSTQQSKVQQPVKQSADSRIAECIEKLTTASISHDKSLADHEKRIASLEVECGKISSIFKAKKSSDQPDVVSTQAQQRQSSESTSSTQRRQTQQDSTPTQTASQAATNQQNAPINVATLTSSRTEFTPGDLDATLNKEGVSRGWMYLKRFTDPTGKVIDCWLGPKGTREEAIKFATGEMVKPVVIFRQPNGFRIENLVNFG